MHLSLLSQDLSAITSYSELMRPRMTLTLQKLLDTGLGYLDGEVFTTHPRGIAFLKIFSGDWWDRNLITIFNVKSMMDMFELADLPG